MWKFYRGHFIQYFIVAALLMILTSLDVDLKQYIEGKLTFGNFSVHIAYNVVVIKVMLNFFITTRRELDKIKEEMDKK